MRYKFNPSSGLRELYREGKRSKLSRKIGPEATKAFPEVISIVRGAPNELELRRVPSLHYEKLERSDYERSLRVTPDKWRLIVWMMESAEGKYLWIDRLEDYHDERKGKSKKREK